MCGVQESELFPKLEEVVGVKGLMQESLSEHRESLVLADAQSDSDAMDSQIRLRKASPR